MDIINAVGRRKSAVARIYLSQGSGAIKINKKDISAEQYFSSAMIANIIKQPLQQTDTLGKYDITITVQGGGFRGQAEAARLGIARALCIVDPEYRALLKPVGYLTRDSRVVERKKYGHKKARKSFQFSKR